MEMKNKCMEAAGKVGYALLGVLSGMISVMGYYPFVPAFFASCCLDQRRNLLLYIGMFTGMGFFMPLGATVKYLFVVLVLGIAIRFYRWANRRCSGWTAGLIAGLVVATMNCSGMIFTGLDKRELILGILEGMSVFGITVILHYLLHMCSELVESRVLEKPEEELPQLRRPAGGRMHAFAEAVDGLSVAFAAMGQRTQMSGHESVAVLEREITTKLCAGCSGCTVCWNEKTNVLSAKIQRMLRAVMEHSTKEEILNRNYVEACPLYSGMVEEAIRAFSRMELNEAWYKRLRENRLVIAEQLDSMAGMLQEFGREEKCLDAKSRMLLARIRFEVKERGLEAEEVHIYEDTEKRRCIRAVVRSKWGGGIPAKNYLKALERATGQALRLQKDARSILTQEKTAITAYEDTCFYAMSAVSAKPKDGVSISGDNFSLFTSEDGKYHICLSDGMGSGPEANRESDMVVELMEKFMEAGFPRETAIRMMNSTMVLKGENASFSTMDFAVLDLYTGELELTKIGAAASFIRHRQQVSCVVNDSLPAGADAKEIQEPARSKLSNGDFLVMVTDGVLEYLHVRNPEEKIAEMISEIRTDNAGALAQTLMERVMLFTGGHALDDMTIIVTGIWEK